MSTRRVYMDHNATTPMRPEVREVLVEALDRGLGNPSSVHGSGREARALIDDARDRVAAALGVDVDEVTFTSGGTESNNLALFGALAALPSGAELVTSPVEHAAVREVALELEAGGAPVRWLPVDARGAVVIGELETHLAHGPRASLVSVMGANNELGTVTDMEALRAAIESARPGAVLHCDAVQCLGKIPMDRVLQNVDLASLSAHKVGGPVGVGVLYKRAGVKVIPRTFGGSQEAELRPGTESAAIIAAAATAVELAVQETESFATRTRALVGEFWRELRDSVPDVHLNGPDVDADDRLPNTINLSFPACGDARMLVTRFDLAGLEVSAGSACASGSLEPSHVLSSITDDRRRALSAIRFSLGRTTDADDVRTAVDILRTTPGETT